ncbi:hypothetical protein HBH70_125850 [Parastagonospora nodorum]|nr:hypothetical protein HBH52_086340 [Parastagonospora nodorum]KAH4022689.1 hypothetical protein HBI09_166340 [Parastagonospora nodorum]KAH4028168.1 hypothetical protein HBI13_051420 [Parastagonospora nodorum]KAH4070229.1 hypothetical protein HBH50_096050 [Parastagonospora nodorum]KAH4090794.1 hypothetical protein HBH48_099820 [Parastagonospora nodorum]
MYVCVLISCYPHDIMHLGRRSKQDSRTGSVARAGCGVANNDSSGSSCTEHSAPSEAGGGVTCHDDSRASSLADTVADWTSGDHGDKKSRSGSGGDGGSREFHLEGF